jgi:hypothetical protein
LTLFHPVFAGFHTGSSIFTVLFFLPSSFPLTASQSRPPLYTDLNFLTIHGRSRYPGLHVWARNSGKRISPKLPRGHLLVQAGKQLECVCLSLFSSSITYTDAASYQASYWRPHPRRFVVLFPLSSLLLRDEAHLFPFAGYHEVVCTAATVAALEARLSDPKTASRPQVRISSTFFYHLSSDYTLSPRTFRRQVKDEEVVQKEVKRLEERGERWEVEKYEEGMKVGTLIQVRFHSFLAFAAFRKGFRRSGGGLPLREGEPDPFPRSFAGGAQAHLSSRRLLASHNPRPSMYDSFRYVL